MKNRQVEANEREERIKEVVILLDRAMNELNALGIDIPASYAAMAHDLLVERLFSYSRSSFRPISKGWKVPGQ